MEKTVPVTEMMPPAMAASTDRAAVAPPEKSIGIVPRYVCVS